MMYPTFTSTLHQGDIHFFLQLVGKQFIANHVMAIIYTIVPPVDMWQAEHLHCILMAGNKLNLEIGSQHDYLLISDISEFVT